MNRIKAIIVSFLWCLFQPENFSSQINPAPHCWEACSLRWRVPWTELIPPLPPHLPCNMSWSSWLGLDSPVMRPCQQPFHQKSGSIHLHEGKIWGVFFYKHSDTRQMIVVEVIHLNNLCQKLKYLNLIIRLWKTWEDFNTWQIVTSLFSDVEQSTFL